jgi:hypothetical protein
MSQDRALKFKSAVNRGGQVLGELTYAEGCLSSRDEVLNCPYTIVGKIAMVGHCVKPGPVRRRFSGEFV